jgi:hypothetical protein
MATILTAPNRLSAAQKRTATTLYLAGPFDDGPSWRDEVIDAFADLGITIIDPRNARWPQLDAGTPGRRGAFDWQCAAAFDADVVIAWVPAGRHAPTALMLLGYLGAKRSNAKRSNSVVVGGDGWDGLVRLFAQNHRFFALDEDLSEVIRIARLQVEQAITAKSAG